MVAMNTILFCGTFHPRESPAPWRWCGMNSAIAKDAPWDVPEGTSYLGKAIRMGKLSLSAKRRERMKTIREDLL